MTEINTSKSSINFKEQQKKDAIERKKNILYLIHNYLIKNNLSQTVEALQNESLMVNPDYELCDNVDLEIIFQEFLSFYQIKYHKQPKILRKSSQIVVPPKALKKTTISSAKVPKLETSIASTKTDLEISVTPIQSEDNVFIEENVNLDFSNEPQDVKELAEQISKEIINKNLGVKFSDCVRLEAPIEALKEAIIYPKLYPKLFKDFPPWKGILLYGPPGTGKTLLAKALASESKSNFMNVTSSTFISKWRGDSEKMLKILFKIANFNENTIIFIDEVDALCSTNKNSHEASIRFKSELLTQIDGISQNNIFVLATTNSPWDIDSALLRRFEKRIFVPLPDFEARIKIFQYYFAGYRYKFTCDRFKMFAEMTENYSGSDIKIICKEAKMVVIRKSIKNLTNEMGDYESPLGGDILDIIDRTKSCVTNYERYIEWKNKFGTF